MNSHIVGIGTAVPEFHVEQADAAEQASGLCVATAQQKRLLTALYLRAGVEKRHSVVLTSSTNGECAGQAFYIADPSRPSGPTTAERMAAYDRFAGPLALNAALCALRDARVSPKEITHLISVSCSGFAAPGFDLSLIQELPLRPDVARTHIGFMGCHAALNALRVARAFSQSDPDACVLVCAVELCSLHHQFGWQPEQIVANALFSDGAAAAVVRADLQELPESSSDFAGGADLRLVDFRSAVLENSLDCIQWHIGDHGFEMALSPQLPGLIEQQLGPWLESWLGGHGLCIDKIGSWAVHPGGPRIVAACAESIARGKHSDHENGDAQPAQPTTPAFRSHRLDDSEAVLSQYGNMSSPTVLFILDRMRKRSAKRPIVALAFGPGVAVEAALLK